MGIEQVGVEAIVAGMGPFRANANEYVNRVATMTGATKRASQETSALGQVAIGAARRIGALAVDGFLFAARHALRFAEDVIQATLKGTALSRTLEGLRVDLLGVAKTELNPLFQQFDQLAQRARPALEALTQFAARTFATLASNAASWGENIVNQLAQGMWNAVGAVLDVLTSIASQIAGLLMPGSPPRILPNLDDWGKEAAQLYIDSWGTANFDVFNTIAGTLESQLRSLAGKDDTGLIPRILGTREAIAQAVDQVRRTGQVTEATLQGIYKAAGATTGQLQAYVKSVFDLDVANSNVAAAQEEVNRLTKEYDALLKPVDDSLSAIDERQQQLAEDQRMRQLELIQNDPNALLSEKEMARLEIQKILAERQKRALLTEKKGAVDAAQAKLDDAQAAQTAAQQTADSQQAAMDLATQQNNLLKEQMNLLDRLSQAASGGGAKGGGAGGIIKPVVPGFGIEDFIPAGIQEKWAAFVAAFNAGWASITAAMQPAVDSWNNNVVPAWNNLVAAFQEKMPLIETTIAQMVAATVSAFGVVLPAVFENLGSSLNSLAAIWRMSGDQIIGVVKAAWAIVVGTITTSLALISGAIAIVLRIIQGQIEVFSALFKGDWQGAWDAAQATVTDVWEIIKTTIGAAFDSILAAAGTTRDQFLEVWGGIWDNVTIIVGTVLTAVSESITTWLNTTSESILTWIGGVITAFATTDWGAVGKGLIDGIIAGITGAVSGLATAAANAAAAALQAAKDALGISSPSKLAAKLVGEPFSLGIAKGIMDALPAVAGAVRMASGAMVPAPAIAGGQSYNSTYAPVVNYSPTYQGAPPAPQMDVAIMRVFWER